MGKPGKQQRHLNSNGGGTNLGHTPRYAFPPPLISFSANKNEEYN